jgi:segregation and condensation protein A
MTGSALSPAPEAADAAYRFILPTFEGPLDLLLHLIRVNELDVTDIPVVEIARQYDAMLDLMQEMNLEIAGEFLLMAATLVYIKSRLLLPADVERIEAGLEEDPRASLTRALLEHQRARAAAEHLAERARLAGLVFSRPAADVADAADGYLEVGLYDLLCAFRELLERAGKRAVLDIRRQRLPLAERIRQVLERLDIDSRLTLTDLVGPEEDTDRLIVTFLAILELVRMGAIVARQSGPFAELRLARRVP